MKSDARDETDLKHDCESIVKLMHEPIERFITSLRRAQDEHVEKEIQHERKTGQSMQNPGEGSDIRIPPHFDRGSANRFE
jgi:hypothetical protein